MTDPVDPAEQLERALRWLESHRRRLATDSRGLRQRLAEVEAELERLNREIATARERLARLKGGGSQPDPTTF